MVANFQFQILNFKTNPNDQNLKNAMPPQNLTKIAYKCYNFYAFGYPEKRRITVSIFGSAGASTAAGEILALIDKKLRQNKDKPEVVKVLREIQRKAREIQKAADDGWY